MKFSTFTKRQKALLRKSKIREAIKELPTTRIDPTELFSLFTADIINKKTLFTR